MVNILNTTELLTLKYLILYYVNFTLVKKKKQSVKCKRTVFKEEAERATIILLCAQIAVGIPDSVFLCMYFEGLYVCVCVF